MGFSLLRPHDLTRRALRLGVLTLLGSGVATAQPTAPGAAPQPPTARERSVCGQLTPLLELVPASAKPGSRVVVGRRCEPPFVVHIDLGAEKNAPASHSVRVHVLDSQRSEWASLGHEAGELRGILTESLANMVEASEVLLKLERRLRAMADSPTSGLTPEQRKRAPMFVKLGGALEAVVHDDNGWELFILLPGNRYSVSLRPTSRQPDAFASSAEAVRALVPLAESMDFSVFK